METWLIILLSIIAFIIIIFFVSTYIVYRMAFYNDSKFKYEDSCDHLLTGDDYDEYLDITKKGIEIALNTPHTDYDIKSHDGLNLHGRYYEFSKGAPIILEFHGYKGNCVRDLAGGLNRDKKEGYNIFMVDLRGHGMSDGRTISFGIKERLDVLTWVEFLNKEFNNPIIFLYGISMGAATVLLSSSLKFPSNVKGIIADCPYSSAYEITTLVALNMGIKKWFSSPMLKLAALIYGHFSLTKISPKSEIVKSTLPILIIHGTGDHFVPVEMSIEMASLNKDKVKLSLFEGAPHGYSCYKDIDRYFKEINEFKDKILNNEKLND